MAQGPFSGPRPFASASMIIALTFNRDPEIEEGDMEYRLRRNTSSRVDVAIEGSRADSRVQVRVVTNEEEMTYATINRIIAQIKDETDRTIEDRDIDIFCT